jgi:hypothetical protein
MVLQMVSLVRTHVLGTSQMAAVGHIERDFSPNIVITKDSGEKINIVSQF